MKRPSKRGRAEAAAALRRARAKIAHGEEQYICFALERDPKVSIYVFYWLTRWIRTLLEGEPSYEVWLIEKHRAWYMNSKASSMRDFREGRLQWLDWMIAELEEGSDEDAGSADKRV